MALETWLVYCGTILLFMVTPGPSHLLMLGNSLGHGFKRSWATAAGDLSANALQMLAAGLGLAALLLASQGWFLAIKLAGVAYLVFMAWRMWKHASASSAAPSPRANLRSLWLQGFLTSASNPKAVLFFAALFPQFLNPGAALGPQIAVLGLTYLVVDGLFLAGYGASAGWLRHRLGDSAKRMLNKIGALALFGAAIGLGLRTLSEVHQ